jgi:CRP/FNR family transcriptional regulator, cyclic AMP receptor protein
MDWPLLAGVPAEDVRQLLSVARRRTFKRGEIVFHHGDPADSLHLIVKGRFAVRITTPLADTALIAVHGKGDFFGELALVGDEPRRSATVAALEESETRSVFRDDFFRLRRHHPGVDEVLVRLLAEQVRRGNERIVEAHYVDADTRVRRRVLELGRLYGDDSGPVTIPLTQEDLAEMAGTSRATVNRVLREEEKRGMLELRRGKTTVLDPEALAKRARV